MNCYGVVCKCVEEASPAADCIDASWCCWVV